MHELFEEQVRRTPGATAVVADDASLTYAALNARANRFASYLAGQGVGPEKRVGVLLSPSADLVAVLLGVLKVGGAYVPVDVHYPQERIALILRDAAAHCVVNATSLASLVWPDPVCGDTCAASDYRAGDLLPCVHPDNAAYVIYTSGSAGRPKGVVVTHRSLAAYLLRSRDTYSGVTGGSLLHSSIAFDLTVTALYTPLISGGCVRVAGLEDGGPQPSLVKVTPSHLELLQTLPEAASPSACLVVGGEALSGEVLGRWRARHPNVPVYNSYGPTETTVNVTEFELAPGDPTPSGPVPIGRPFAGVQVYVLDDRLVPVPSGEPGELYIAGVTLARGYLDQPGMTGARFVANPFGLPGTRMYRTGDVVRWRHDDQLEFLGRIDDQVKVRGFRIEPGEIQSLLATHPQVGQAVVVAQDFSPGDRRLVAYVVAKDPAGLAPLREYLAAHLPDYMLPSAFVMLDSLPLTVNGKVDRRALPLPKLNGGAGRPAWSERERILCALFAEVLGVAQIAPEDSFFDLGGHSLLAIRLISRVRAMLGLDLSVRDVFESPTVAALDALLNNKEAVTARALGPYAHHECIPPSYAQRGLWFLERLRGPSPTYNVPLVWRLTGPLDLDALRAAVNDVVQRHESLRTVFPDHRGEPVQQVMPTGRPLEFERITENRLDERLNEATRYAFDLTAEIPLRVHLFAVGPHEHVLLWLMHHIAVDGWSFEPLAADLACAYTARLEGRTPAWTRLPGQYADFALWQRELVDGADLTYWTQRLAGMPEELALPYDRPRPATASHDGRRVGFHIDALVHRELAALARRNGSTLFMVMQAAVVVLLHKVGGGNDIPIGTPIAGRADPALDGLIGLCANLLVLRTDVSGDPTFEELLTRIREADIDAFEHQEVPFELVVDAVKSTRSLARHPLVQVVLTMDSEAVPMQLPGLVVRTQGYRLNVAKYDLDLNFDARLTSDHAPDGIHAVIGYNCALFDEPTIQSFADGLARILIVVAADARQRLSRISVLDPAERHRILVEWNATKMAVPEHTLPVLLEMQAARTPDLPAVQMGDTTLTYSELNERSNQVGRHLIEQGAGPESVVALMMPRSVDQIVTLWGTLKAGAAYLPVDPAYPAERIAFMLRDAAPVITITESIAASHRSGRNITDAERVCPLRLAHPAYLIYTSGSTGLPKAVSMPGSAMVNLLTWTMAEFPTERMAQFSSLSFDTSAMEVLAATVGGGCLVVPPESVRRDAEEYVQWLVKHEVNEMLVPNLVVEALCDAARTMGTDLPAVRRIAQGGEALVLSPRVREFFDGRNEAGGRRLINHYGPTETHLAIAHLLPSAVNEWPTEPPIGRPIGNMRAYVLDAQLQPVPAGVIGELYLAGAQLSRGYFNRPSLTASRYVANPFDGPGTRMYRTGDLVRWSRDGELVFVGRVDHQVKFRGFRIELGEIEAVLRTHPDVEQVAVIAVEEHPGVQRLVAYLVAGSGSADPEELRRYAAQALPDYMVPSAFVQLDRMPLNPNGKLDRRALPMPARAAAGRPASTPVEQALCEIYAEVLTAPSVSADDDFFALGGHSLNATKVISRIRTVLRVEVPLRALFENPTPAGLAGQIVVAGPARSALVRRPRPDLIPLSSAQLRLWFLHQMEGPSSTYNLPVIVRMRGVLDCDALREAMGDVVARHESLRTVFPDVEGRPYQRILTAAPRWEFSRIEENELATRLDEAAGYAFDLASEPPLALWLFEVAPTEHVLLILMHHIAGDGWSMTPLTRDLATAYDCRLRGEPPKWPPLRIQYADYALWQRELLDRADVTYWSSRLADLPSEVPLPFDRPRPAVPSYVGNRVAVQLGHEVHRGLAALATRTSSTLFMVLHAGLAVLLHKVGAGDDLPIGTVVAGRGDETLDDLVGFFVNTLVLRTDLAGDPTFSELLQQVRDHDIAAFTHQDLPFEHLVEVINPPRLTGRHPLFQVMLAFNNNDEPSFGLTGLTASVEHMRRDIARFDLSVSLWEHSGPDGEPAGIDGYLQYNCDVFDHASALALAERLQQVFATVAADPEVRIKAIDVHPMDSSPVAVPAPSKADGGLTPDVSVPGSPQQRLLAEVFAEVLGLSEVDTHESFFKLGGHSLLAIRLIGRVQAVFGVRLTIRDVFEASTVTGLTSRLTADSHADSLAVMLPLRTTGGGQPLFCVHPAAGTSWVYSGLLRFIDHDHPIYGLQARGLREPQRTPASAQEMVADYLMQLRAVQPHGPYALLGWSAGGLIAHLLAVRLQEEGEEVSLLAAMDSYPPIADRRSTVTEPVLPDEIAASIGQDLTLAGLGELDTSTLVDVFTSTRALLAGISLGVFHGDLLLFEAVRDRPPESPFTADLWHPHITGRLLVQRVDCVHSDMTTPRALDCIGPVLQAALSTSICQPTTEIAFCQPNAG